MITGAETRYNGGRNSTNSGINSLCRWEGVAKENRQTIRQKTGGTSMTVLHPLTPAEDLKRSTLDTFHLEASGIPRIQA